MGAFDSEGAFTVGVGMDGSNIKKWATGIIGVGTKGMHRASDVAR